VNTTPVMIIIFGVERYEKGLLGFLVRNVAGVDTDGGIMRFFSMNFAVCVSLMDILNLDCSTPL
jgi:hypothetical protein